MKHSNKSGKTRLNVGGEMTPEGANRAGLVLAIAGLTAATLFGMAALLFAVAQII